jgi:dTDP-4-amino-4,6-dideoxygalactose transaminase
MSIFREIPPTAGFPLYTKDLLSVFSKDTYKGCLEDDFKQYLGSPYAKVTYSGTAAFYIILESLKKLSNKKTVIIPSFICPLVPLAIKRAALKVKVCDINKDNFNFNSGELGEICAKQNDILAIVPVHLAGIPLDFEPTQEIAQKNKIFIIEDCAQSLGAIYKGKKTGTLGDFSFFSLCRGKGLTIYEGGILIVNKNEFVPVIENSIRRLEKNDFLSEGLKILELAGYWIFYRPLFFWFVYRLPQIFWEWRGRKLKALLEYFTIDFGLHKVSKIRKSIGHITFNWLEDEINQQREKASNYIKRLKDILGIKFVTEPANCKATYSYLALLFDNPDMRIKAQDAFRNSGLGLFQIYASPISEYDYLKNIIENKACPNASYLAQRHISLSTSAYLEKKNSDLIIDKIKVMAKRFRES